jgi:hypothetical protein
MVLAAYEDHTDRNDWRTQRPPTRRYPTFLSEHGYALSDVERRACCHDPLPDDTTAPHSHDDTANDNTDRHRGGRR